MEEETPLGPEGARTLRFLKTLVTVLTVTMIAGVLTITALLVIRLNTPTQLTVPASIDLPDGATATAFTRGVGWYAVVTADDRILIYDTDDGTLIQEIDVTAGVD